jgi:hypothetical protein
MQRGTPWRARATHVAAALHFRVLPHCALDAGYDSLEAEIFASVLAENDIAPERFRRSGAQSNVEMSSGNRSVA